MAGLSADQLNDAFLKSFIPETLYLVPGEDLLPAQEVVAVQTVKIETATVTKPSPVPLKQESSAAAPLQSDKYVTIGENKKGVVVLVTLPDNAFRELPKLELLQKMLAAIGFKPEAVAYVNNVSGQSAVFEELQQLLTVKYIISFASRIDTRLPHDKFTLYNPVKVADIPVVFSQSLDVLEKDVDHKKKLWAVFQQVFL